MFSKIGPEISHELSMPSERAHFELLNTTFLFEKKLEVTFSQLNKMHEF